MNVIMLMDFWWIFVYRQWLGHNLLLLVSDISIFPASMFVAPVSYWKHTFFLHVSVPIS